MNTRVASSSLDDQTTNGMAFRLLEDPSPTMTSPDQAGDDVLPFSLRLALPFLGHWRSVRQNEEEKTLVTNCKEHDKRTGNNSKSDEEERVENRQVSMEEDDRYPLLMTYEENMNTWKDHTSLRKRLKGYCRSDLMGMAFLIFTCCTMMYDMVNYVRSYWGAKEYALHFVTYATFLVQLMVLPYWFLYTRIKYGTGRTNHQSHRKVSTMSRAFITRRINIIVRERPKTNILSWFPLFCILSLPVMAACFRVLYYYKLRFCRVFNIDGEESVWNSFLGLIIYGCFCYILYLERRSFEIETRQIFRYCIEQAPHLNVDAVLNRICQFNLQYKLLRKHIRRWMAFTIVVSTWGLTSHITWNYLVFSQKHLSPDILQTIYYLNILVSSQKITFIAVPFFALGGLNLDHIWRRFREDISHSRQHKYKKYWKAVIHYVKDINDMTLSGDVTPSLISTGVGIYLGLNLTKSQDIGFWNDPDGMGCNLTNLSGI